MNKAIGAILIGILAIGLTLFSGVLHGRIRHAGGLGVDLESRITALNELPETFGRWERVETVEFDQRVVDVLECKGYHQARYVNLDDGTEVYATVLLGPSGPIAVHTPEGCMPSQNNKQVGETETWEIKQAIGESKPQIRLALFKSSGVEGYLTRVGYAWTMDGNWVAPENTRGMFAGQPYLYKVQVSSLLSAGYDLKSDEEGPVQRFMPDFLEALNKNLFDKQP